ncbi:MAG: hypothetical protein HYY26_01165 [Acidobacteria bacterium]|nr:hypothetical protein [Acidobacteriota bacterium]
MGEDDKYWAAIEARLRELAPDLKVELKSHDENQGNYVLLVRHTRTGKARDLELPEDPVWDMVDNQDKREEAKVDQAILEAKSELED